MSTSGDGRSLEEQLAAAKKEFHKLDAFYASFQQKYGEMDVRTIKMFQDRLSAHAKLERLKKKNGLRRDRFPERDRYIRSASNDAR